MDGVFNRDFKKILAELCQSRVLVPERIASKLGIDLRTVLSALGVIEAQGYVRRIECKSCRLCPLRSVCPSSVKPQQTTFSYYITEKGRRVCRDL